jgi:2-polyprenyl-6-methoxyphenol hydroxylase-like FAD-dependent oxidoreductase
MHNAEAVPRLIAGSIQCGVPAEFYANTRVVGPLASFSGADHWVEHPYANSVALIGDAAAASDPSWGQGLSLTLRDARVLRDALLAEPNWDAAGHRYAIEHDRYYGAILTWEDWFTSFFYGRGAAAEERRARAFPLMESDPTRVPDFLMSGPGLPLDDNVRRRFFGED